jgi:nicotinate dehydrogenase subunit B
MTDAREEEPLRQALLRRGGVLAIVTPRPGEAASDIHVCLTADGQVYAFNGHVDLGTGIRTALAQIVAEELDVPLEAVTMMLGDTENVPNQGPTIASETIQVTAKPLRIAAAQARRHLLGLASEQLGRPTEGLTTRDGAVRASDESAPIPYAALLTNRRIHLELDPSTALKPLAEHRVIGQSVNRVDIPAKATGAFTYVHDVRVPDMVHGRVIRPPYAGIDGGEFIGRSLESVDRLSIAHIPGIIGVVVEGDFVGVVAEREEHAAEAAACLKIIWKPWATGGQLGDLATALRAQPAQSRRLIDQGDVEAAMATADSRLDRTYLWPYQMHASIGPSCAVAALVGERLTVWSGTQNPYPLRADLARLTGLAETTIEVIRAEAAGCYGRNCADDVAADAVLLARAVGRPVRVQLTREQEHLWEPKGAGQLIDVAGALGSDNTLLAYDFQTRYPSNAAPTLALLLTGRVPARPAVLQMGDRTAAPAYDYENLRITVHDMAPIVRAAWLRGVSAMPNVFAHESFIDELALQASADPVEFRLRHLTDPRAADLVRATAARAEWEARVGAKPHDANAEIVTGRGFAQARYSHGTWPGVGAAWSAWAVEVAVNRNSGEVAVTRVVVGQDTGMMINPAGVRHQIHGNVVQSISRTLKEEVTFTETTAVANREWGGYPILTFPELPSVDVVLMDRQYEPPMGAGESASVPSAAAIVNAVYDATGVRFRELPLTPERVLAGLRRAAPAEAPRRKRRFAAFASLSGLFVGLASLATIALPIRPAIAPIPRPDPSVWSAATIEQGRRLAALGACAVCHTGADGVAYAGGLALETPFGTVVSTNITPDPQAGIGAWSYPAFERAMREGVHRDGSHLYPAFPYPSFSKTSDADLQALYAYLMAQPAVPRHVTGTRLAFPFNIRPLMAGWNLLFNRPGQIEADPSRSDIWNRGRYLVDGLGHCGACHTPRNVLGAERGGGAYLGGGIAEGWDAPALTHRSTAPLPWSEEELFMYLRTGASRHHGAAGGPMAPVIAELQGLPEADIRAMAAYLASFNTPDADADVLAERIMTTTAAEAHPPTSRAARLYEGACASCHDSARSAVAGALPLGLSTNMAAGRADNFLRKVLHGLAAPSVRAMPGFRDVLDDRQIIDLTRYARARFAPSQPGWSDIEETLAQLRTTENP